MAGAEGVYQCIDCELYVCAHCSGGQDSCPTCNTGPRCDECAADHEAEHKEEAEESTREEQS
jgi:hypothetical protein